MPEGGIYVCNWVKKNDGYRLTLHANPSLEASGPDLDACMEDVCMQICEWNGDGEAVLEMFPPHDRSRIEGGDVLFSMINYNDRVDAINYTDLFEDGVCPVCKFGLGRRSDVALTVRSRPRGVVCAVTRCLPILLVYDSKFVESLTDDERAMFEIRPVFVENKRSVYLELIAKETIRTVGYKGAEYPTVFQQSFRCKRCGREKFEVKAESLKIGENFVDARSIESNSSTMIVVDDGWRHFPSFRMGRWEQLLRQKNLRGLLSSNLVVLTPEYVEHPQLVTCDKFDWIL